MLNSVRNAASDVNMLRHSTILYTNSAICIHLNDVKRTLGRAVKFPGEVCISYKYLINNLIVIVYSVTIFHGIMLYFRYGWLIII